MDRRIVALLALALLVLPLVAVPIPVEAQNYVEASSLDLDATLIVKVFCPVAFGIEDVWYVTARRYGATYTVFFELLKYEGGSYRSVLSVSRTADYDPYEAAITASMDLGVGTAKFYIYNTMIVLRVTPASVCRAEPAEVSVVVKRAALSVSYVNDYKIMFNAILSGGNVWFEIFDLSVNPPAVAFLIPVSTGYDTGLGGYVAYLWFDPATFSYGYGSSRVVKDTAFTAVFYNFTNVNVLELYYNGQLVNRTMMGVSAVKTEYVTNTITQTETVTNTVTTTINVTTTVINLVPVTQTSYVTETVTVPRAIITTETSIMLVLFMLLLLALGIVLYYLMKRG